MEFKHTSVLLQECIDGLNIRPDGLYIDGTLGGGGHSFEIAKRLTQGGVLIGIDQDEEALSAAGERLFVYSDRVRLVHDNYENMENAVRSFLEETAFSVVQREEGQDKISGTVDGILLDLGVSSYQLDNPERGFSYRTDAPLDMRMDRTADFSARDIVNTYSAQELTRILRDYGEEKCAAKIAANIVKEREIAPIETTGRLAQIVERSIPMKMRERGGNPCKRTFQAVRIACNRELEVLEDTLDTMIDMLKPGGRLCIITFHSLEDRIVKNAFRRNEKPCICPPEFPVCVCGRVSKGRVITRKPILPGKEELAQNRRSASAKLRIFEKQ
ncbi:MAG: 16S rRNA (cytosine(1402)-N(4))-methyltransferase RsmH [Sarcina sp.]|uniref:16S rRNA (cytosine(1402)-N(4))-methyltransferase RsmH n=1 Tax=Sarcina sp. DSM 11001 TaxID=1798184 RepID=UPI00088137BA|nr:16S rRNA (cytosine(1402)-N(4))-methyltransferase RsmH [Sarcina sp. DSM 11001]MBE6000644.1 16S rRNA (cytosine(1402)-N(4))-methyltransferase RsmH [Sarcina sp.]SDL02063.1 16S rRNA (cytosine1402-N4)-methyltransferase [Sarcina sp. DSM 11001]